MSSNNSNNDLNAKAVKDMIAAINKNQPIQETTKELDKIMENAFKQAEKEIGRPMTYAEMRERFG